MVPTPRGLRPPEDELLRGCPGAIRGCWSRQPSRACSRGLDSVFRPESAALVESVVAARRRRLPSSCAASRVPPRHVLPAGYELRRGAFELRDAAAIAFRRPARTRATWPTGSPARRAPRSWRRWAAFRPAATSGTCSRASRAGGTTSSVRAGRSIPSGSACSASISWAAVIDRRGRVRGTDFPSVSAYDQAECLRRRHGPPGHRELHGCVGASYGGMVALASGRAASGASRARRRRSAPRIAPIRCRPPGAACSARSSATP